MKINIQRLAGVGFGAALAIILSVDAGVEAAPVNTSQGPAEISASDGLVMQAQITRPTRRVRVRRGWRGGHRTPRQMVHRQRRVPVQRAM
jgi:hypothetical protein